MPGAGDHSWAGAGLAGSPSLSELPDTETEDARWRQARTRQQEDNHSVTAFLQMGRKTRDAAQMLRAVEESGVPAGQAMS